MSDTSTPNPLTLDTMALGKLIRQQRLACGLSTIDAAFSLRISRQTLTRLENGEAVRSSTLLHVLRELGLAMLVMPKAHAITALDALGHKANWDVGSGDSSRTAKRKAISAPIFEDPTPTLFVDFDGTLHVGHALLDATGEISLDSGRPLLEFAGLLDSLLRPFPTVRVVVTTSWLRRLPFDKVVSYLPAGLASRVVGTTSDTKPRLGELLSGTERTAAIVSYAYGKGLANWLAIDDSVYCAFKFGREPGELVHHFVLLDSARGINDKEAQERIRAWLETARGVR